MIQLLRANIVIPLVEIHQKRDVFSKVRILQSNYFQSQALRETRRKHQIYKVLKVASVKVPYYRDLFKKIGFNPEVILKDVRFVQELPFLTKEILREQGSRLINEDYTISNLHLRKTAGSTGPSTSIYYDQFALDWSSAVNQFVLAFSGRRPEDLEYFVTSKVQPPRTKEKIKHWIVNRRAAQANCFDENSMDFLLQDINKKRPFILHGNPSTIFALARFVEKKIHLKPSTLTAFESTGEILDPKKATFIEKALGCRAYNRYGNAEFGVVAHSKEDSQKLEVIDYICLPETVSLGNGLNEIVLTTTTNLAMPLVRYRTGDLGDLLHESGREYFIKIQGRIHDLIEINNSVYSTHYIQDVLEQVGGVDEFQILIKKNGTLKMSIVPKDLNRAATIKEAIDKLFGDIEINFTNFEDLILSGWRDKFRYVIKE